MTDIKSRLLRKLESSLVAVDVLYNSTLASWTGTGNNFLRLFFYIKVKCNSQCFKIRIPSLIGLLSLFGSGSTSFDLLFLCVPKPLVNLIFGQCQILGQLNNNAPCRCFSLILAVNSVECINLAMGFASPHDFLFYLLKRILSLKTFL